MAILAKMAILAQSIREIRGILGPLGPNPQNGQNGHFGPFPAKTPVLGLFQGCPKRHAETTGNGQKGVKIGAKMTHFGPYLGTPF